MPRRFSHGAFSYKCTSPQIIIVYTSRQTVATIHSYFLAMTLFPDVQRRAQAEIDLVVGMDRLPSVTDMQDLPFVRALVKEVGRWFTVIPLGECQVFC